MFFCIKTNLILMLYSQFFFIFKRKVYFRGAKYIIYLIFISYLINKKMKSNNIIYISLYINYFNVIIRDWINMLFFANFWHISAYFSVF